MSEITNSIGRLTRSQLKQLDLSLDAIQSSANSQLPTPLGSPENLKPIPTKRTQVKHACANCRKACKKCDEIRPCQRCIKYNIECYDSVKAPRAKKVKSLAALKTEFRSERSPTSIADESPALKSADILVSPSMLSPMQLESPSQLNVLSELCQMLLTEQDLPPFGTQQASVFKQDALNHLASNEINSIDQIVQISTSPSQRTIHQQPPTVKQKSSFPVHFLVNKNDFVS